ncbi:MAG TPA: tRNA lysidine(34) synthetase TilS [Streptosporangiaceae bacterium]|nr:tRNA lysidine(34) synthetase TilS [Streptosporangiaceae bacterium]
MEPAALVLAGCSGGPDSLALAAALAFEAAGLGLRAGMITVDHGLQACSKEQAARTAAVAERLGLDPAMTVSVTVTAGGGPEAAARHARYMAFESAMAQTGARALLLGHTMDDQAETVLLGLARGSGARSIAGMGAVTGHYLRPFLGLRREQTIAACAALGLSPWHDPQNRDETFRRIRVRERILPLMEELIGPGVTESLARTADRLRADADLLDSVAAEHAARLLRSGEALAVGDLAGLPEAIRTRLLRLAALGAGVPAGSLSSVHIAGLEALVTNWHGQRGVDLPGAVRCERRYGRLHFTDGS